MQLALDGVGDVDVLCALTSPPSEWASWIPTGSIWRYLDTGVAPASGWQEAGFDDSGWAQGPGPLGYGDDVATEVSYGPDSGDKYITTWFRGSFTLEDPAGIEHARLGVQRDDGVLVTLNGVEVLRDNLPEGEIGPDTEASSTVSGGDETTPVDVDLDPGLLLKGENIIAVEIHQAQPDSSDIHFDLELQVEVPGTAGDVGEDLHVLRSDAPSSVHDFLLQGLLAGSVYTCDVTTSCPGATPPDPFEVRTEPLPSTLPELTVSVPATDAAWGDYALVNHGRPCAGDDQNRLLIVDHEGRIRWYFELEGLDQPSTIDIESQYLGDGRVAWGGGDQSEGSPEIVDLSGEILYTAAYPGAEQDVYHHDMQVMDDGRIMGLINTSDSAGGRSWEGFALIEHDPATLEVTWSWYSQDAVDVGDLQGDGSSDPWHANSMAAVTDDEGEAVYVSFLTTSEIVRIDRETGRISWRLGSDGDFEVVDTAGAPLGNDGWFSSLHAIDITDDGDLMVYDNGRNRESRAVRYTLDTANRVATLDWSYAEDGWYEPIWGDADKLDNGDVLINMAHAYCWGGADEHWGSLVEVDPSDNSLVWRVDFTSKEDSSYRSQKLDGCEVFQNATLCPALLK